MRRKMYRLLKPFLIMVFSFLLITACYNPVNQKPDISPKQVATAECKVVKHKFGETCIPIKPQRIISLEDAWILDPLLALGVKPVGTAIMTKERFSRTLPADKVAGIEIIGNTAQPSVEKIIQLKPDLILSLDFISAEQYNLLSEIAHTALIEFDKAKLSLKDNLRLVDQLVGEEEKVDNVLRDLQVLNCPIVSQNVMDNTIRSVV